MDEVQSKPTKRKGSASNKKRIRWESIALFAFGVIGIFLLGWVQFTKPDLSHSQCNYVKIVLAVAVAGIGTILPGRIKITILKYVTATGALALLIFVVKAFDCPSKVESDSIYKHQCKFFTEAAFSNKGMDYVSGPMKCSGMPPKGTFTATFNGRVQVDNPVRDAAANVSSWVDMWLTDTAPPYSPAPYAYNSARQDEGKPNFSHRWDKNYQVTHVLLLQGRIPENGDVTVYLVLAQCQTSNYFSQCSTVGESSVQIIATDPPASDKIPSTAH